MDTQSRKFQITINNPTEHGYDSNTLVNILSEFKSIIYWCMSDEIGEEGTPHTHIYIYFKSAVRFSTIKNKIPECHIEVANGTSQQNRDYVFKEGKWKKEKKAETNIPESHLEFGEMPIERPGQRNDLSDLYDLIHSGMSDYEILSMNQNYMLQLEKIQKVRRVLLSEKYKHTYRTMEVTYIYGETGSGKTRGILEEYGYGNVYRVTDYLHPFDSYEMQDVIMFEEFRSSLKIQDMLNYLDGYPIELPCRYENKVACYTKVYILSNISPEEQYRQVQIESKETYNAFMRRVHKIIEKNKDKEYQVCFME